VMAEKSKAGVESWSSIGFRNLKRQVGEFEVKKKTKKPQK